MDPTASIITVIVTAHTVTKKLHHLIKALRKAPGDIVELMEEVQFVRIVLQDIREKQAAASAWFDLSALAAILRRAEKVLNEVNLYVSNLVAQDVQEELRFNRVSWLLTKEQSQKHLQNLKSLRDHAVALVSCATLSANTQLALSFKSVLATLESSNATQQEIISSIQSHHTMTTAGFRGFEDRLRSLRLDDGSRTSGGLSPPRDANDEKDSELHRSPFEQYQSSYSAMRYSNSPIPSEPPSTYQEWAGCPGSCPCSCHRRRTMRIPTSVSWFTGQLSVKVAGVPSNPCDSSECNAHSGFSFQLQYYFPTWLLYRMVHIMASSGGNPTVVLSVPRILSQDMPIFELAREGDIPGLQKAISQGMVPTVVTEHGESLLQYSIAHGKPLACRFLIQAGANPTAENKIAATPGMEAWDYILREAFDRKTLDEFRAIFHDSGDLDERGFTLVHKYVLELRIPPSFSKAVEENMASIDTQDRKGRTPLHWAALRGDVEKLTTLLRLGASPKTKDYGWGNTPLDYAVRLPSGDCTKALLERGADVNSRTSCLWTPLYGCGAYRRSPHEAGHVESARYILRWKPDVTLRDEDGHDALIKAARQDLPDLVSLLLREGEVPINTADKNGVSAVAFAIRRQSHKALEVLLDHDVDYHVEDKQRNSILHSAASFGDHAILQVLDSHAVEGVDPDSKNADGLTPMELVRKRRAYPDGYITAFSDFLATVRARNKEAIVTRKTRLHSPAAIGHDVYSEMEAGHGLRNGESSPMSSTSGSGSVTYEDAQEYLARAAEGLAESATGLGI